MDKLSGFKCSDALPWVVSLLGDSRHLRSSCSTMTAEGLQPLTLSGVAACTYLAETNVNRLCKA
jgi:hypothetical protein